jgi:type II secretory pathway component PulF
MPPDVEDQADARPRPKRPRPEPVPEPEAAPRIGRALVFGKVRARELAAFCRQLGVYLNSGVGITRALESLEKPMAGTAMAPVLARMQQAVKAGQSISDAAEKEPQVFDRLFLSLVRVGEERGGLPEMLKRLASLYEARDRMWRQARSALVYPTIVIVVTLGVGALLTMFVLPVMVSLLRDMTRNRSVDLPAPTKLLMAISDFMQSVGWWLVPVLIVGGTLTLKRWYATPSGKAALDRVILRVPVMGKLVALIDTARFARTLGDLMGAGVGVDRSLRLTSEVVQFVPFREAVDSVRAAVKRGSEFAPALRATGRFESDLVAFVETGEETGNLPETLRKVADDYEERAELMTKNLASLLQPLITIVLGVIVGFLLIAFVMAYLSLAFSF